MLRLVGAILIILACGLLGQVVAMGLSARQKELRACKFAISALETEIAYGANPLPSALGRAGKEAGGVVGELFCGAGKRLAVATGESAAEIWQQSLDMHSEDLPLNMDDIVLLHQFGVGLGESNIEDQLRRLKLLTQELAMREEAAAEAAAKMGKIWQSLGWGCGIILALFWI